MKNVRDGESESENEVTDSTIMSRIDLSKSMVPKLEIPVSVQQVISKIEQAQLFRARQDISLQVSEIMQSVQRIIARYTVDETLHSRRKISFAEYKRRRMNLLEKIAAYANSAEIKENTLVHILAWLEEWNGVLSEITATDVDEHHHWIAQLEILRKTFKAIESNVKILIRISICLLEEKKKQKKKITSRGILWKSWKERVIKRPATIHALRPDQMVSDEFARNIKVSEIQGMLQELISTAMFNKLENSAIKYISSTIVNLSKALSALNDEVKLIDLQSANVYIHEINEREKELSLKIIHDLSEKNVMLQQKLRDAEEKCEQLIRSKVSTVLPTSTLNVLPELSLQSSMAISKADKEDSVDTILAKQLENIIDAPPRKGIKASGIKWDSAISYTAPVEMTPDLIEQQSPLPGKKKITPLKDITEDKVLLKKDGIYQKGRTHQYQSQKRRHAKGRYVQDTSVSGLSADKGKQIVSEPAADYQSELQALEKKGKERKPFSEAKSMSSTESKGQRVPADFPSTDTKGQGGKRGTSSIWEGARKVKPEYLLGKSQISSENKEEPTNEPIDKESKSEMISTTGPFRLIQHDHPYEEVKTKGKKYQISPGTSTSKEGKTGEKDTSVITEKFKSHELVKSQSGMTEETLESTRGLASSDDKSEQNNPEEFQKAILAFLKEKIDSTEKPLDENTVPENELLLNKAEVEKLETIKAKMKEYFQNVAETVVKILRKYKDIKYAEQIGEEPMKQKVSHTSGLHIQKPIGANSKISTLLSYESMDPVVHNLIQMILTEIESEGDASVVSIAEGDHQEEEKQRQEEYLQEGQEKNFDINVEDQLEEKSNLWKKSYKMIKKNLKKEKEWFQMKEGKKKQQKKNRWQEERVWEAQQKQRIQKQSEQDEKQKQTEEEEEGQQKQKQQQLEAWEETVKKQGVPLEKKGQQTGQVQKGVKHLELESRWEKEEEKQKQRRKVEDHDRQWQKRGKDQMKIKEESSEELKELFSHSSVPLVPRRRNIWKDTFQSHKRQEFHGNLKTESLADKEHPMPITPPIYTQSSSPGPFPISGQSSTKSITVIHEEAQALGITVTPKQAQVLGVTVTPEQAQALGITLTPQQAQGQGITLTPEQAQALGVTLTPEQAQALGVTLTPEQVQAHGVTLTPQQAQVLGVTLTPLQAQAQGITLTPLQAQALGITLTPEQAQALGVTLTPEQAQELGVTLTPEQAQALGVTLTPEQAQALGVTLTPQQAQALGVTLTPQQAQAQGITLTPQQAQALGATLTSEQAQALGITLTPEQVQALGVTLTPQQAQALAITLTPQQAQALGVTLTPEQVQELGVTLTPEQTQALGVTLTPQQVQELGVTLTPQQAQAQGVTLTPQQAQALGVTFTPEQVQTQGVTLTPEQAQALGVTLTPEQVQELGVTLTPEQAQALGVTLTPEQVQELGVTLTPEQAQALGVTLTPQQVQELGVTLTPQQAQAQGVTLTPQQAQALGVTLTPEQVQTQGVTLTPEQAQALGVTLTSEQVQELGVTLTPEQAQALGVTLTPQQVQELGVTLTPQQAQAQGVTLTPEQAQALGVTLTPQQVQELGVTLTPEQAQALGVTLTPQQVQELGVTLTPQQAQAQDVTLTPEQTQALGVTLTPQQVQELGVTLTPEQAQVLGVTLTPQHAQALGVTLTSQQVQAQGVTLTPEQAQAPGIIITPEQADAQGITITSEQAQAQAQGITITHKQAQAQWITITPEQAQAQAQAQGIIVTPRQEQTQGITVTPRQADAQGITVTPRQAQAQGITVTPRQAQAQGITITPEQAQAQGITVTPRQAQAQGITITPEQAQAQGITVTSRQAQAQGITVTPEQAQAQRITVTPRQAQAQGITVTPEQAQAQRITVTPRQAQAQGITVTPDQAQAQRITITPKQAQAQGITVTPRQAQAQGITVTPEQAQAQRITVTPRQAQAQGITVTPKQAQAQGIISTPQQAQALGVTATPAQALGVIVTPEQAQALGVTVIPEEAQALGVSVTPEQDQAQGFVVTPQQTQAQTIILTPQQAHAYGVTVTPEQTQALRVTETPQQAQAFGITVTPEQAQALGVTITPMQAQAQGITVTPEQAQALGITLTPQQSQAQGITLTAEQFKALVVTLTPEKSQSLGVILTHEQVQALRSPLILEQDWTLKGPITPNQDQMLKASVTSEQTWAMQIPVTTQEAQKSGVPIIQGQDEALGVTITQQQTQALQDLLPEQAQALELTLTPEKVQTFGITSTHEQAQAVGITLTPEQKHASGVPLTHGQAQALETPLTEKQARKLGVSITPGMVQEVSNILTLKQNQALGVPIDPQNGWMSAVTLTPEQTQDLGAPLTSDKAHALGSPITSEQVQPLGAPFIPGQAQPMGITHMFKKGLKSRALSINDQLSQLWADPSSGLTLEVRIPSITDKSSKPRALHIPEQALILAPSTIKPSQESKASLPSGQLMTSRTRRPLASSVCTAEKSLMFEVSSTPLQISGSPVNQALFVPGKSLGTGTPDPRKVPAPQTFPSSRQTLVSKSQPTSVQLLAPKVPPTVTGKLPISGAPPTQGQPLALDSLHSSRQFLVSRDSLTLQSCLISKTPLAPRQPFIAGVLPTTSQIPTLLDPLSPGKPLVPRSSSIPGELMESGHYAPSEQPQAFQLPATGEQSPYLQAPSTRGQHLEPWTLHGQASPLQISPTAWHPSTLWAPSTPGQPPGQKDLPSSVSKKRSATIYSLKSQSILVHPSAPNFKVPQASFTTKKFQMSEVSDTSEETQILDDHFAMGQFRTLQSHLMNYRPPLSETLYVDEGPLPTLMKPMTSLPALTTQLPKTSQISPSAWEQKSRFPPINKPWILTSDPGTKKPKMMVPPSSPQELKEQRYFVDVQAQRKNLILLHQVTETSGLPSELHTTARNLIIETLHTDTVQLGYLFRKYIAYRLIQRARNNIIKRLQAIKNSGKGYETQNLYIMLSRIDDYQKKMMAIWTKKQKSLEQKRNQCLRKMMFLFSQLQEMHKLNLSQPIPLIINKKQIPAPTKSVQQPFLELHEKDGRSDIFKKFRQEDHMEALWNADQSTSSYPITEKTSINSLWAQLGGYPAIPMLLQLDVQSTFRKSLASVQSQLKKIPK